MYLIWYKKFWFDHLFLESAGVYLCFHILFFIIMMKNLMVVHPYAEWRMEKKRKTYSSVSSSSPWAEWRSGSGSPPGLLWVSLTLGRVPPALTDDLLLELLEGPDRNLLRSAVGSCLRFLSCRSSPVQVQGFHTGSAAAVRLRRGGGGLSVGVCGLPQSVILRQQLAQMVPGEVGSPGSAPVHQGLLPPLLHLDPSRATAFRTKAWGRNKIC